MAGIIAGKNEKDIETIARFARTVGIAFQIQDDILNLTDKEFAERKGGLGEDITEGKRSLPVIYTLQVADEKDKERLLEILKMHTFDQDLRDEAIAIMKKHSATNYAKDKARKMVKEAWDEIDKILPEAEGKQKVDEEKPTAKEKLKAFACYLIERKI